MDPEPLIAAIVIGAFALAFAIGVALGLRERNDGNS